MVVPAEITDWFGPEIPRMPVWLYAATCRHVCARRGFAEGRASRVQSSIKTPIVSAPKFPAWLHGCSGFSSQHADAFVGVCRRPAILVVDGRRWRHRVNFSSVGECGQQHASHGGVVQAPRFGERPCRGVCADMRGAARTSKVPASGFLNHRFWRRLFCSLLLFSSHRCGRAGVVYM